MGAKVAVAGAGIYGATVAIRLAEQGHSVRLFDPLGILRAASAINQYRVHAGYHYPRSLKTIQETLQATTDERTPRSASASTAFSDATRGATEPGSATSSSVPKRPGGRKKVSIAVPEVMTNGLPEPSSAAPTPGKE